MRRYYPPTILLIAAAVALPACASSAGSPPAGEFSRQCRPGETLICTSRDPGARIGDPIEDYDHCVCRPIG